MDNYTWLDLQLFAGEGTGEGGGEGAAETGVNSEDAAQQRLRELGVPEDKIRRRAKGKPSAIPPAAVQSAPATQQTGEGEDGAQAAAAENPTEEGKPASPARMSWDEIMADPEYNKQMQAVVQSRLKSAKGAEEAMAALTPALELLARQYKIDPTKMDYQALAAAISDDNSLYEDKALEMGVPVEEAKKIDQKEQQEAREARTLEQQAIQQHIARLEQQGEELKKIFPNFDLRKELQNPVFARMTAPGKGIMSVEDAYRAVHRQEIEAASMQVIAQRTAEKFSNAIQAGGRRPDEAGTSGQAPSVTTFDYRAASREQREALKQRIRDAAARGQKLYPGQ
jgi:hypothetical protein